MIRNTGEEDSLANILLGSWMGGWMGSMIASIGKGWNTIGDVGRK